MFIFNSTYFKKNIKKKTNISTKEEIETLIRENKYTIKKINMKKYKSIKYI